MYYENFEKLCLEKNVTASKVSKATGISTATLSSWKKNVYTPKQDKLQLIADYFGVTLDYLINGKEKESEFSPEQADLWIAIRHDKELLNALEKYMKLSEENKKRVLERIDTLSEV